ncbi:MAG: DUF7694 domain-containing protein [Anaerolineae bacterium]
MMKVKTKNHETEKPKPIKKTNTPSAFHQSFPDMVESSQPSALSLVRPCASYEMDKLHITYAPAFEGLPAMLSVNHPNRYPTWDEIVHIRYQLVPDDLDMAMLLPPIGEYINYTGGRPANTFTLEAVKRGKS